MDLSLLLAVEDVIPPDHPVAILAVPLGLLFMGGSVYVLLWSNYGAKKAGAIYSTAFFGFSFILGVFWWFGGPGIPPNLGLTNLPGQEADHYDPVWYAFEPGSERAEFFTGVNTLDAFQPVDAYIGREGADRQTLQRDPAFAALSGSSRHAVLHGACGWPGAPVRGPVDGPAAGVRTVPGRRELRGRRGHAVGAVARR